MGFYTIFEELCREKGVPPTQVARENGFAQGTVAMWKKRDSTPNATTVAKLADYFGVSVDYLLGKEEKSEFNVGDSFLGGLVTVSDVKKTANGGIQVTYNIDDDGLPPDELMDILLALKRAHERVGIPPERLIELTEQIINLSKENNGRLDITRPEEPPPSDPKFTP